MDQIRTGVPSEPLGFATFGRNEDIEHGDLGFRLRFRNSRLLQLFDHFERIEGREGHWHVSGIRI